jgi:Tfp pilus assembly protein PilF
LEEIIHAHHGRAFDYYAKEMMEEAIAEHEKAIALDPEYPYSWLALRHTIEIFIVTMQ